MQSPTTQEQHIAMRPSPDTTVTTEFIEEHQTRLLGHEILQRSLRGIPGNLRSGELAEKTGIHKGMPARIITYISQANT